MFASHPAKHPIIILKDVRYGDLRALLDFMYKGEVAVDQDRLPAFLRLAESLKIRGLAEFCEDSLSHQAESGSSQPPIFDSLLDSQKRSHHPTSSSSSAGQMIHQSAAAVAQQQQHNNQTPPAGIELLPLSSQQQHHHQRQTASGLDFSVPTGLGLFHGSPLALAAAAAAAAAANSNNTPRSSSSLSSSTKRPSSPQTYAHHRRKRGRPPRQSYSESVAHPISCVYY
jgi:hypothetical protein